jgi:salicylate hydroxylase
MGPNGHMLTFPVNHGQTLNIVAFHTTSQDWPDIQKLTRTATRDDALRDYDGFGQSVKRILQLTEKELDVVSDRLFAMLLGIRTR